MALRNIRILGDEILKKQAKEVTEMTPKIEELIDDMFETMYDANGCGLAAPQVGIRKRMKLKYNLSVYHVRRWHRPR